MAGRRTLAIGTGRRERLHTAALGLWPPLVVFAASLTSGGLVWPTLIAYHVGCIGIPSYVPRGGGGKPTDIRQWLPTAIILSALTLAFFYVFGVWLQSSGFVPSQKMRLFLNTEPWAAFGLYWICINPAAEEFYWRGFLLQRTGILLGSVYFALMHYPLYLPYVGAIPALVCVSTPFLAGLLWGWLKQRFGTLWPGWIIHVAVNGGMYLAASQLRQ